MTIWCDASTAVQIVESGDRVYLHGMCSTPTPLIEALVARGNELRNVEILQTLTMGPATFTDPRWSGHFRLRTFFVSPNVRAAVNAGHGSYAPVFLSYIPKLFLPDGLYPIDVAFIQVSPPDKHGYCSLGPSVDVTRAAVDHARHVVALINPRVPRTHGDTYVPLSRVEYAIKWEGPLHEVGREPLNEQQKMIGRLIGELIEDGATLELGIGAIPDAVLQTLTDRRDLGVHTEMFSDGVLDLVEQGVITGAHKIRDRGRIVSSFVMGSRRLMDFLDENPMVELRPTDYTNDPHIIRQFDNMVAVNSALQVDLTGQVCAESIGTLQYSGVGGQMDFLLGTALAAHGKPIIALSVTARAPKISEETVSPYTLTPVDGQISRIVPTLTPGAAVTTTRAHVHYVVTEHGRAMLLGLSVAERARSLIALAAPSSASNWSGPPTNYTYSPSWQSNRLCCKQEEENKLSRESLSLFSFCCSSVQRDDQGDLASHSSFVHPLHLSLSSLVHHLKSLQASPGCLAGDQAHSGLVKPLIQRWSGSISLGR